MNGKELIINRLQHLAIKKGLNMENCRDIADVYEKYFRAGTTTGGGCMSDTLSNGQTDWHNWMRDTMKIDPKDSRTIEIVWSCIARCKMDCEKESEPQTEVE